jgi:predicted NACHT family NTPase
MELLHQLEPEVVTRIYEHDEFMTDVIGQNPTGKNKHIAIVGEPGAGKTTLLDKIATHIQENNRDFADLHCAGKFARKDTERLYPSGMVTGSYGSGLS